MEPGVSAEHLEARAPLVPRMAHARAKLVDDENGQIEHLW